MRYGFDANGGFFAIDDSRRRAAYAYPTSPHAKRAHTQPERVAAEMSRDFDSRYGAIAEEHYQRIASVAYMATR